MSEPTHRQYSGPRKFLFYTLVMVIPLTLFCLSAELMAHVLSPPQQLPAPPPVTTIDPYKPNLYVVKLYPYIYTYIPGSRFVQARSTYQVTYEINSIGFRGPEIPRQPPNGFKRLLVIGDSIVEGHGVDFNHTFAYRLGENLRDVGWEVINVGVGGASPIYYAANLDRYLSLKPDAVLILIYDNDTIGDRIREVEYFNLPIFDDAGKLLKPTTLTSILSTSRAFTVLHGEWQKRIVDNRIEEIAHQNRASWESYQQQLAVFKESPELVPTAFIKEQWQMSQPYLDYLLPIFHAHQVQLFMANLSLRPRTSPHYSHVQHLDEQVTAWATENQLPFLSLLPTVAEAYDRKQPSEIIIPDDSHPTPWTHGVIETALRPWLLQQLKAE